MSRHFFIYKKDSIDPTSTMKIAEKMTDTLPCFLTLARTTHNPDGSWSIHTPHGVQTGYPGQAYWILLSKSPEGLPIAGILLKSDADYHDYMVMDDLGKDLDWLDEIDP